MTLQYLKDNYNNTTAVVIPISDWEKITRTHQDINLMLEIKNDMPKKLKPSDFRGCISSQTADNLNAHIEQSRTEWNNNI
jgi:hypothetical protein